MAKTPEKVKTFITDLDVKMKAQPAHDYLCLGSGGNSTRLCLDDQDIGMVKSIQVKDWQLVFYSEAYATNGVFGLGTEDI